MKVKPSLFIYEFSGSFQLKDSDSQDSYLIDSLNNSSFEIEEKIEQKTSKLFPSYIKVQAEIRFYEGSKIFTGILSILIFTGTIVGDEVIRTIVRVPLEKALQEFVNKKTQKNVDLDETYTMICKVPDDIQESELWSIWISAKYKSRNYLPFGQDYDREISYMGKPFKISYPGEIRAWSRIQDGKELLCVINTNSHEKRGADIIVDAELNPTGHLMIPTAKIDLRTNKTTKNFPWVEQNFFVNQTSDGKHFVSVRELQPHEMLVLRNFT